MNRKAYLLLLSICLFITAGFTSEYGNNSAPWHGAVCDLIIEEYPLLYSPESVKLAAFHEVISEYGFPKGMEDGYVPQAYNLFHLEAEAPLVAISFESLDSKTGKTAIFQYKNGAYTRLADISMYYGFYKNKQGAILLESYAKGNSDYYEITLGKNGYLLKPADGIQINTLQKIDAKDYPALSKKIKTLTKDSNGPFRDWRYIYAEFLEDHINSPYEQYFSLYDFDMDGTPELIMATSVEYTASAFFTVKDGGIRSMNWQDDTYRDTAPYVYYNEYYNIRGILTPYYKNGRLYAPVYTMTEKGDINSTVLLYEDRGASPTGRFALRRFSDGSLAPALGASNGAIVISDEILAYLKQSFFAEEKKLDKYYISVPSIYETIYGYQGFVYGQNYGRDRTSLKGLLDFMNE